MRWVLVVLLGVCGSLIPPPPPAVLAHDEVVSDEEDASGFPLDIRSAELSHGRDFYEGRTVTFTLHTYGPFDNATLAPPGGEDFAVAIGISTDRDEAFERLCFVYVQEDAQDGAGFSPYAVVTKGRRIQEADRNSFSPREAFAGYARVRRPSEDSVEVTIPVRALKGPGLERFRWKARMVSSNEEENATHFDYVPMDRPARGHTRGE
ncbi:MAG: hypothetical protein M3273_05770 [Actinomycetota bacterium]|nr:hypothetical protein [Actinomycetota bacterium]